MSRRLKITPKCRNGEEKRVDREAPVKRVSIFINNIDSHIADSYQKLKRSKVSQLQSRKQSLQIWEGLKQEEFKINESRSTLDNFSKLLFTSEKKDQAETVSLLQSSKCEDSIGLIDNEIVSQYVNLVYSMYNIPDPMKTDTLKPKVSLKQSVSHVRTNTGSSSLRKKSSASQLKDKIVLHRDIDLTPFNGPLSNRKEDKDIDISLVHGKSKEKLQLHKSTVIQKKRKNSDCLKQTNKIDLRFIPKATSQNGFYTPEIYRYCFACEEAVLQVNLKHHQSQCCLLRQWFTKPIEELVDLLDQKIARLSKQIKRQFVDVEEQSFMNQYRDLKRSVGEWIQGVESIDNKENRSNNLTRKKMSVVQQRWDKTIGNRMDAMARLHWFSRLRQNLRHSYSL